MTIGPFYAQRVSAVAIDDLDLLAVQRMDWQPDRCRRATREHTCPSVLRLALLDPGSVRCLSVSDGGGLTLNVHFHTSVLDGVFTEDTSGIVRFHEAAAPTDEQVAALRRLVRRELDPAGDETSDPAVAE